MPVINPTGNPFLTNKIKVPKDKETLSKLQIKVDLQKIGEAPRAYSQILKDSEDPENMVRDSDNENRQTIWERFEKVQDAQRSMHPLTIQLLNESRGIVYKSTKANLAPNTKVVQDNGDVATYPQASSGK